MKKFSTISKIRENYCSKKLKRKMLKNCPFKQLKIWLDDAINEGIKDPTAMSLSTCSDNIPSCRTVLLKDILDNKIYFFTNYNSKKAKEISKSPNVALLFFWKELERQVSIIGTAKKCSQKKSIEYFHSRPFNSRIGAWASEQSTIIPNRKLIVKKEEKLKEKYKEQNSIPYLKSWGGFKVKPIKFEFWQGRPSRLHDRFLYKKSKENTNKWQIYRLSP